MPIKFSCPNCRKPLNVKDSLAGKRGTCPKCKKPLMVPAGGPQPSVLLTPELEEEAARALVDEPAPPKEEEPKTLEFPCPQCDEPVQVSADLEGRQTPCPHCRRII